MKITTEEEYEAALCRVYDLAADEWLPEELEAELLALSEAITQYEDEHYSIDPPDPEDPGCLTLALETRGKLE